LEKLNEHNIETRPLWKPMHMQPVFKNNDFITTGETAVDEDLFSRGLCLPSDIKMTEAEQQKVIDLIKSLI
jgi:dTDP-4-amino-4,6-dideoxygalactose transaminase